MSIANVSMDIFCICSTTDLFYKFPIIIVFKLVYVAEHKFALKLKDLSVYFCLTCTNIRCIIFPVIW